MNSLASYSDTEVSAHTTWTHNDKDIWVIFEGKVYDISKFICEHPGGEDVLIDVAGTDITQPFKDIGHSEHARSLLEKYLIGRCHGYDPGASSSVPMLKSPPPNFQLSTIQTVIIFIFTAFLCIAYYLFPA